MSPRELLHPEDVVELVDRFYDRVNADDLLSPIFNDLAKVDWPSHLPKMYSFWQSLLFGTGTYSGQPMPPHLRLPLTQAHFDRWIALFEQTVTENFVGPKADEALYRAQHIAQFFAFRCTQPH